MKIEVVINPEAMGGFSVSVPTMPGCHSQGESLKEALANIQEAAKLWLEAHGQGNVENDE